MTPDLAELQSMTPEERTHQGQERIATALERIARRLDSWDNGGGINLVPGNTMRELMGGERMIEF